MIDKKCIAATKRSTNIVDVISETVPLLEISPDRHQGPSPFAAGGQLIVMGSIQRFKCLATGKSGDVFDWLRQTEKLHFAAAVRNLANRIGIRLRYERSPYSAPQGKDQPRRSRNSSHFANRSRA